MIYQLRKVSGKTRHNLKNFSWLHMKNDVSGGKNIICHKCICTKCVRINTKKKSTDFLLLLEILILSVVCVANRKKFKAGNKNSF